MEILLSPGSVSAADNQGKQRMEEEMKACPCTCATKVAVDLTVILHHMGPRGGRKLLQEAAGIVQLQESVL